MKKLMASLMGMLVLATCAFAQDEWRTGWEWFNEMRKEYESGKWEVILAQLEDIQFEEAFRKAAEQEDTVIDAKFWRSTWKEVDEVRKMRLRYCKKVKAQLQHTCAQNPELGVSHVVEDLYEHIPTHEERKALSSLLKIAFEQQDASEEVKQILREWVMKEFYLFMLDEGDQGNGFQNDMLSFAECEEQSGVLALDIFTHLFALDCPERKMISLAARAFFNEMIMDYNLDQLSQLASVEEEDWVINRSPSNEVEKEIGALLDETYQELMVFE